MLHWCHCHPGARDCGLGAQNGLGLVGAGCPARCSPEPLALQEERQGQCWWLQVRLGTYSSLSAVVTWSCWSGLKCHPAAVLWVQVWCSEILSSPPAAPLK